MGEEGEGDTRVGTAGEGGLAPKRRGGGEVGRKIMACVVTMLYERQREEGLRNKVADKKTKVARRKRKRERRWEKDATTAAIKALEGKEAEWVKALEERRLGGWRNGPQSSRPIWTQ